MGIGSRAKVGKKFQPVAQKAAKCGKALSSSGGVLDHSFREIVLQGQDSIFERAVAGKSSDVTRVKGMLPADFAPKSHQPPRLQQQQQRQQQQPLPKLGVLKHGALGDSGEWQGKAGEPGQQRSEQPMQLAYVVDPPHHFVRVFAGDPLSGVAALTGLSDGRLLVLERSGCPGLPPFENRIYLVDTRGGSDVTAIDRDVAQRPQDRVAKALLWRDQLGCNLEGMCLGPKLKGSSRSVVAIADNNGIGTPNQLIGFVLEEAAGGIPVSIVARAAAVAAVAVGLLLCRLAR